MNTNKRESEEIARIHGRPGQVAKIENRKQNDSSRFRRVGEPEAKPNIYHGDTEPLRKAKAKTHHRGHGEKPRTQRKAEEWQGEAKAMKICTRNEEIQG